MGKLDPTGGNSTSNLSDDQLNKAFYSYVPNFPIAVIFGLLYTIVCLATIVQYFRLKRWYFWALLLGAVMEAVGFDARIVSIKQAGKVTPYIIQYLCPILAPAVVSAACYMTFKRIVFYVTPEKHRGFRTLWVPARWLTPIFVGFDVLSFLVQLGGGAIVAAGVSHKPEPDTDKMKSGANILKLGLILQLICFGFFTFVGARFMFVSKKWQNEWPNQKWVRLNLMVNVACGLILVRSVYRLIEFAVSNGSNTSYITTHEWLMWVFDALLMLLVITGFVVIHPGNYLPKHVDRKGAYQGPKAQQVDIEFAPLHSNVQGGMMQPPPQHQPYNGQPQGPYGY